MINLDDVEDGIRELERASRLGLSGAMITEYPAEDRRYDQPEYERFWAAAAALDLPLSLHTATRRQGKIRGAGPGTLRDASSHATKAFYPALSMCDLIFSGVFERHPRLTLAIVEFELSWVPNVLTSMDYTYRERHGEAIYRFKNGMLPSDFFRRNVVLSFQEDAIGIGLRRRQHDVGLGASAQRVDVSAIAEDPGGDPRGRAGRRTGQACPGPRSGDRRRQHRPRVPF
jgi:predicted TIM-barrel fold metal-dependent hydrolase